MIASIGRPDLVILAVLFQVSRYNFAIEARLLWSFYNSLVEISRTESSYNIRNPSGTVPRSFK